MHPWDHQGTLLSDCWQAQMPGDLLAANLVPKQEVWSQFPGGDQEGPGSTVAEMQPVVYSHRSQA